MPACFYRLDHKCGAGPNCFRYRSAATAPPLAAPAAPAAPGPITTNGSVDVYYGYDFDHANGNDRQPFLCSHGRQNEFTINQAKALGTQIQWKP